MNNSHHFLLYGHGGCYNHGVEAITSCTISYLRQQYPGCFISLVSHFPEQDQEFGLAPDEFISRDPNGKNNREIYVDALAKITENTVAIHVGGDNFCYKNWQRYTLIHEETKRKGGKSILWGCSIDKQAIDEEMLNALKSHDLILVRDPITYHTLSGLRLTNVSKVSDIAFGMIPKQPRIPPNQADKLRSPYIVLNLSPLVCRKNATAEKAFRELITYILSKTNYYIVLLPHVLMPMDNDYDILQKLATADRRRITLISDKLHAWEYKYIIALAKFCVASRTHVTIAAYSSCVPTLAIGYSTKAIGIAQDLDMSDFVLDIMQEDFSNQLLHLFSTLTASEKDIKKRLEAYIPDYINLSFPDQIKSIV